MTHEMRVEPYPEPPQTRKHLVMETYEYQMPFNYENITVARRYMRGMEFHGVELNAVNSIAADEHHWPPDTIEIVESQPIVRVVVIGSTCVPPGFVQLEAEPIEEFYTPVDVPGTLAVRYRIDNLWGMHMRVDTWLASGEGVLLDEKGLPYADIPAARKALKPRLRDKKLKAHYRENPLAGMSCAIFEIPASRKVIISGGSTNCAWTGDGYPDDVHYSFRIIRVTVDANR